MNTYISFLRGVNVSGKNLIKMNSLQELYEKLGFSNVKTYIQSGNVVFRCDEAGLEEIEQKISVEIFNQFLLSIPVIVREKPALKVILEQNPFFKEIQEDIAKLYITFLSKPVGKIFMPNREDNSFLPDKFVMNEQTIYLYCPDGYGRTKLNNNFFEHQLSVMATTRNLKTLMEVVRIGDNIERTDE